MAMIHFAVAFGVLLHVAFWGAGLALLGMPRPWRRFWPALMVPAGLALQSAVVWAGSHTWLSGTDSYAWWSEVIPAALLWLGLRRLGARRALTDVNRFGLVWAITAGCLVLLVLPLAFASRGLTTVSLGSCDAADYAAGARVLREFVNSERIGFLGLTEVVRVGSVRNFIDYWLRLNHFTPSALMAINGTVLGCAPHEIASLLTAALLAGALPVVFWSSRAILGYSGGASLIIAGLFGVSPIPWYAYAHVSPGQLLFAHAIVLITWAGVGLWHGRLTAGRGKQFAVVLAIGYWLVLGSYNFFIFVALVPAIAYAGGLAVRRRAWRRLAKWLLVMLAPLAGCAIVFYGRVAGLAERLTLLQTYDFGWRIPPLTAEGWLGMVQGGSLEPWSFFGLRWVLCAAAVGVLGWALLRSIQEKRRAAWLMIAIIVPVLAGYLFLQARGAQLATNASYDAYKLFAAFYPLLLPAFCWWVTLRRSRRILEWLFVCAVAGVVVAFNVVACGMFAWKLSRPPLIVDGELRQLRKIDEHVHPRHVVAAVGQRVSAAQATVLPDRHVRGAVAHGAARRLGSRRRAGVRRAAGRRATADHAELCARRYAASGICPGGVRRGLAWGGAGRGVRRGVAVEPGRGDVAPGQFTSVSADDSLQARRVERDRAADVPDARRRRNECGF
jgi:hypothetical protein